ncbi:MAG TPA: D-alanyl-D-alanine carboxypeptidase/D-alanyl-D-alanine-endopeptidase [Gemmatimonadaceae bacterium]|nr:D-alanyl-D-alanine carboxypeptidase/D-alanyl-D-alanine-endopeptidase [Gemmatimonadaceae bacterium]
MHGSLSRTHALRVAAFALAVPTLLLVAGRQEALAAPAPTAAAFAPQAASRAKSRPKTPAKRTVRRTRVRRPAGRAAAPASTAWSSPHGAPALASDLAGMISTRVRSGKFGVMVVSLTRGDTLFAQNAGEMMQPASTMKLFSTAVALDRYGPEHRFSTDVLRDGALGADGTVAGSIYLRSDGDPSMSARFYKDPNLPMATLARSVASAGVKHIKGDLVYDASAFDDRRIPEGWKTTYLGAAYAARVSALSLNENLVWVVVRPAGKGAAVTLEPVTTTIPLRSNVRLVGGRGGRISARRAADGGIDVSGSIGALSGPLRYSLVVDDPALFTAGALRAALQNVGITFDGTVKAGKTPASAERVAGLPSPPLSEIVSEMNRESINIVAELLFRDAARAVAPNGMSSAEAGESNLRDFLQKKVGADPQAIRVSDGSGLSTLDFLTPRTMIQLLSYAHKGPWSSAFHGSLPVAGESELLRMRMRSTPAQGNLHAKTGTTNTVVGLGGFVTSKSGEILAFSFIYNGNDRWNAKATMDAMGATLANFVRE